MFTMPISPSADGSWILGRRCSGAWEFGRLLEKLFCTVQTVWEAVWVCLNFGIWWKGLDGGES